jgi:hypothetical protein
MTNEGSPVPLIVRFGEIMDDETKEDAPGEEPVSDEEPAEQDAPSRFPRGQTRVTLVSMESTDE